MDYNNDIRNFEEDHLFAVKRAIKMIKEFEKLYKVKSSSSTFIIIITNDLNNNISQELLYEKMRDHFRDLKAQQIKEDIYYAEDQLAHPEKYKPIYIPG